MFEMIPPPLSLYVHLPWCVKKCPYCDFNSHAAKGDLPFNAYIQALIADLEQDLPLVWGRTVQSIFFGGGTPSLFPAEAINEFLQQASSRLRFAPNLEITLETNPGTAEYGKFELYRDAGINRLSFGVQTFDNAILHELGRIHTSEQAEYAIKLAQDAGFDNFNIDLMYALPNQTLSMAEHDLQRAFALNPTHLSHYQLTLEPNTVFYSKPPQNIPDEDLAWDIQNHCQRILAEKEYIQYEVSAYSKVNKQSAHNLNYWNFGDYLGLGAGAHGKITSGAEQTILRRWKTRHPTAFLNHAGTPESIGGDDFIDKKRRPFEFMLNALRLNHGFKFDYFEIRTGLSRDEIQIPLNTAVKEGWLEINGEMVIPTELGRRFTNNIVSLFMEE